jgi:hypothetical protein
MKLSIIEAGLSRRDFLKKGLAGAVSLSPIGKILAAGGVAPSIIKSVEAGVVKPWSFPFMVYTNTHYGRGGAPLLSDQFNTVGDAYRLVKYLGSGKIGFGADEDALVLGEFTPSDFASILQAAQTNGIINLKGREYEVEDLGDSIDLTGLDHLGNDIQISVFKSGLPKWLGVQEVESGESLLKTFWDSYGGWGDEPIDRSAIEVINKLNLDLSDRNDFEDLNWEELEDLGLKDTDKYQEQQSEEQSYDEPAEPAPREYYGSMHQSFESRLNNALSIVENKRIQFASFNSYGDITVYIDGKKYMYNTDAVYHNKWKKKARYRPFDVLNDIKDQVKRGYATQVYP